LDGSSQPPSYEEALKDRTWGYAAEKMSVAVKADIRAGLEMRADGKKESVLKRRAKMLLQACAFLDIDKVIEYREPEALMSFWKRPAVPQLDLKWDAEQQMPAFKAKRCAKCNSVIRGCSFRSVKDPEGANVACETCYRKLLYGHPDMVKDYKHCVLTNGITPEMSRKICRCDTVNTIDSQGRSKALFPLDPTEVHLNSSGAAGVLGCGLYELGNHVAEAKHHAILNTTESQKSLSQSKHSDEAYRIKLEKAEKKALDKAKKKKGYVPVRKGETSKVDPKTTIGEYGSTAAVTTEGYEAIPVYLRAITDTYPYGNVHMSLRIGPLLIENGVEK